MCRRFAIADDRRFDIGGLSTKARRPESRRRP
jgi:hypothetical protein